jgi:hypothetical protein
VEILVSLPTDDADGPDIFDLASWLRAEEIPGARVEMTRATPHDEAMGAATDTIAVIMSSGGVIALANALTAYIRSRARRLQVAISVSKDGLRTYTYDATGPQPEEALVEFINIAEKGLADA